MNRTELHGETWRILEILIFLFTSKTIIITHTFQNTKDQFAQKKYLFPLLEMWFLAFR
jgi:hypothetical protein